MKIIVGLGNPGKKYEKTRHNAGFIALDLVAQKLGVSITNNKFKALIAETFHRGEKVLLVKPQTFMNLSGESVRAIFDFYNVNEEDLLVISDDKDLDVGSIRVRAKGSSGGQNGIKNIIAHLGTQEFARVKIGIGSNPLIPTVDYVLGKIDEDTATHLACDAVIDFIDGLSMLELMNRYNSKGK